MRLSCIVNQTTIAKLEDAVAAEEGTLQKVEAENAAITAENAALKAATVATIIKLEKDKAALEGQVAVLQAQATSKLADIHGAIAALQTLLPPFPPMLALVPMMFDRDWFSAVSGSKWKIDIDATGMRAHVTYVGGGGGYLTLRGAAPLPRPPVVAAAGDPNQEPLPAYRIVVVEAAHVHDWCDLGFVPSHHHVPGA
jgi:hypothetical protein